MVNQYKDTKKYPYNETTFMKVAFIKNEMSSI
jgi:hypothetical protein